MYPWFFTNAVVARVVLLSHVAGVGAAGIPVRTGETILALRLSAVVTNAVVARAVVLFPAV